MAKKKLAIFDMDGTLVDTKDVNYFAYREALQEQGFDLAVLGINFQRISLNGKI